MKRIKQEGPPLLLFLLLPLLFLPELFFGGKTLYQADLTKIHYPLRVFAASEWLSGRVPLWNPYVLCGFPMLAEGQAGVLYPLSAVFLLPVPPYFALTLFVSAHFVLAAASTYLLARSLGLGRAAATLGGLSFGFGGTLMAQATNVNIMTGGAWLPLAFWGVHRAIRARRIWAAPLAGIPLALQILTSQPQIVFYTWLVLISYTLYEGIGGRSVGRVARACAVLGLAFACGLALSAPQLLPTLELQRHSVRAGGLSYDDVTQISTPVWQWLGLLFPKGFSNAEEGFKGLEGGVREGHVYAGLLPLLAAFLGLRCREHRKGVVYFWALVIGALVLSMGHYTPLYDLLWKVPGFNLFRVPSRWGVVVNFAIAVLAAYGMDSIRERPLGPGEAVAVLASWASLSVGLALVWAFREPLLVFLEAGGLGTGPLRFCAVELVQRGLFERVKYPGLLIHGAAGWLPVPGVAFVTRMGASAALLAAHSWKRITWRAAALTGIALTVFDLCLAGGSILNPFTDPSYWARLSPGAEYVIERNSPGWRVYSLARGEEAELIEGLAQYTASMHRVFNSGGHASPLTLKRYRRLTEEAHPLSMLALTNTRYVLNHGRLTPDAESVLSLVFEKDDWFVYEYPAAVPRAFVVRRVQFVADSGEALSLLHNNALDPLDAVILEEDAPVPGEGAAGVAVITSYGPQSVELEVSMEGDGYLVLLDSYYPGWRAFVDGEESRIYLADYAFRAVYLAGGTHSVRFVYRPDSFYTGIMISVVILAAAVAAGIYAARRREAHVEDG